MQEAQRPSIVPRFFVVLFWTLIAVGCTTTPAVLPVRTTPAPPVRPQPPASLPSRGAASPRPSAPRPAAVAPPTNSMPNNRVPPPIQPGTLPTARGASGGESARGSKPPISARVAALMRTMTLSEKVGQLFIFELGNLHSGQLYRLASPDALKIITTYHPGGIILFGGNIETVEQTVALIRGIQAVSAVPLFIATDEEGGTVSRLTTSGRMDALRMPAAAVVGSTRDPRLAFQEGRYVGRELRSLGINMNLAPVADVDSNPANTVIGTRAFSSDATVAARMTAAVVRGLQSADVSAVVKHFPGHGATTGDSHFGPAVVRRTLAELRRVEFLPFEAGIAAGADGVMIGHLLLPEVLAQKDLPATFSPYVLQTLLRKQLGFRKIIMTDALNMGAIVDYWRAGTAAVDALEAGADMLLMPQNRASAYRSVLEAVKSHEIPMYRLNASVRRILTVKIERGVIGGPQVVGDPQAIFGSPRGRHIVSEIESKAASPLPVTK